MCAPWFGHVERCYTAKGRRANVLTLQAILTPHKLKLAGEKRRAGECKRARLACLWLCGSLTGWMRAGKLRDVRASLASSKAFIPASCLTCARRFERVSGEVNASRLCDVRASLE